MRNLEPGRPIDEYIDRLNAGPVDACKCNHEGRNLVVCIDGTANEFGDKNTNVIELYSLIQKRKGDRQRTYYNSGIGTYARSSRKPESLSKALARTLDLAIARHFESIVLDAYRWLSETYEDGDRIFLFGFSRGAYQVRVLSAMINTVGLIDRGNEKQIPFAYKWYTDPGTDHGSMQESTLVGSERLTTRSRIHTAKRFKEVFSRDVRIHFVGAWDTVSSVGPVRGRKLLPGTTDGMKHVCYFRHALALDERRVKFLPEYACDDAGPSPSDPDSQETFSNTKEVWFAGTHSDVGGGNTENESLDSARPALRWMYSEASIAGLRMDLFKRKSTVGADESDLKVKESLTGFWRVLEYLPIRHLTYAPRKDGTSKEKNTTRRPHRGKARVIQKGQTIHPSVWLSEGLLVTYIPHACLHSSDAKQTKMQLWSKRLEFWRKLQGRKDLEADGTTSNAWKEVDIYEVMGNLVAQYIKRVPMLISSDDDWHHALLATMRIHAHSEEGWRALSREILQLLNGVDLIHAESLCRILDVLVKNSGTGSRSLEPRFYSTTRSKILPHLPPATAKPWQNQIAREFLAAFTDPQVQESRTSSVVSVAFSPDGKHVVAGSRDHKVRVWDVGNVDLDAGPKLVGKPFEGHSFPVLCVAFSPCREAGKWRIASASDDRTIRVWDVNTDPGAGRTPWRVFTGHIDGVNAVAFSQDGTHIASGSSDCSVRIWDVEGERVMPLVLSGHAGGVYSVAYSRDGALIASGSDDTTIRVSRAHSGELVSQLEGHHGRVWSVAFSPDGTRIVSGSADRTVRIWIVYSGGMAMPYMQLEPHLRSVFCVAFAPGDSTRVVSASNDKTIRFWNVDTGDIVGRPFEGHTEGVNSVAYSPDGKRVVSCSELDRTIRIWDVLQEPV
ncbi:WD40 repeat-like protein [Peniophora sp. CONT]|nr:WD40 repeat-like protein [Peniophora sp. CONT]